MCAVWIWEFPGYNTRNGRQGAQKRSLRLKFERAGGQASTNICGRQSVTGEAIADPLRRAEAGEFTKEHMTPNRRR